MNILIYKCTNLLFFSQLSGDLKCLKIWGVIYLSTVKPQVVANFVHDFEHHKSTKVL